jgi:hypothetical protein
VASDCDCSEENTMAEPTPTRPTTPLQEVFQQLKLILNRFKYSLDTYHVCLSMLAAINFEIAAEKAKLIASAILLIAGKVHEFRTPKFVDLLRWGAHEFGSGDLVQAEFELLKMMEFKVPVVFKITGLEAIREENERLEHLLCPIATFQ